MDNFFQKLRDIQKKERNTGNLTEIEDSFYTDASNYLQELLKMVDNNPLSLEAYQLRDAQRITTEICERREFKIVGTAATNVQKSHDIFKGHRRDSELYDVIPFNTTPEEEEFYKQLVDIMVNHRENLMEKIIPQKQSNETKIGFKPNKKKVIVEQESEKEHQQQKDDLTVEKEDAVPKKSKSSKPVLDESQIAMMFGKAPDDVLFDENNNPVKTVKTDITTPFTPPKPPKEDTVSLQRDNDKEEVKEKDDDSEVQTPTDKNNDTQDESKVVPETQSKIEDDSRDSTTDKDTNLQNLDIESAVEVSDVELVEFKDEISTDILDETEKTYGPFTADDIVLLPRSLVKILLTRDVVRVIH